MDALATLWKEQDNCCSIYETIVALPAQNVEPDVPLEDNTLEAEGMNASQLDAIRSCVVPLSLIWGPPGLPSRCLLRHVLDSASFRNRENYGRRSNIALPVTKIS